MGTQKSHFAYRLAWENTSSERIPFLPLHRRDLVSAEQGNKTFIGDRINWKKFEVMGEVIVGIQKSQDTPYPSIPRDEDIQRLVLESRIIKDDDVSTTFSLSSLHGLFHPFHCRLLGDCFTQCPNTRPTRFNVSLCSGMGTDA